MSYAFEGNFRSRPEQNLSGASRKQSKEALLQKVHEERQKRQVIFTNKLTFFFFCNYLKIAGTKIETSKY